MHGVAGLAIIDREKKFESCPSIKLYYVIDTVNESKNATGTKSKALDKVHTKLQIRENEGKKKEICRHCTRQLFEKQITAKGTSRLGGTVNQRKCETTHIHP